MTSSNDPKIRLEKTGKATERELEEVSGRVRRRAYELSEQGGRQGSQIDKQIDHWLRAEQEIVWRPAYAVIEKQDAYQIEFEVPGVKPGDVEVRLAKGRVTLRGERQASGAGATSGALGSRTRAELILLEVPLNVEFVASGAKVRLTRGILTLTLPKRLTAGEGTTRQRATKKPAVRSGKATSGKRGSKRTG